MNLHPDHRHPANPSEYLDVCVLRQRAHRSTRTFSVLWSALRTQSPPSTRGSISTSSCGKSLLTSIPNPSAGWATARRSAETTCCRTTGRCWGRADWPGDPKTGPKVGKYPLKTAGARSQHVYLFCRRSGSCVLQKKWYLVSLAFHFIKLFLNRIEFIYLSLEIFLFFC